MRDAAQASEASPKEAEPQAVRGHGKKLAAVRHYLDDPEAARLVYAMLTLNEGLIHKVVGRHLRQDHPEYEDRVSIGKGVGVGETAMPAGLMGAILNYDPTQGPRFSTYATNSIEKASS